MLSSLYIGATGMKSLSEGMNVTSNNLANCSTVGFKSQMALYSDLIPQNQANPGEWNNNQEGSLVAVGQVGMGVRVDEVKTNFTQGGFESTNNATDLAINGKGFFVVQDNFGETYYSRAGNFTLDDEGTMRNPNGFTLEGVDLGMQEANDISHAYASKETNASEQTSWSLDALEPVNINKFQDLAAKQTSSLSIIDANFNTSASTATDLTDPYFSMLKNYDANQDTPLAETRYSYAQALSLYDSEGKAHEVTIYYDGRGHNAAQSALEFLVADNSATEAGSGSGLLMSGVLTFDEKGELAGLAAYTPEEAGNTDLATWTQAALSADGTPTFSLDGAQIALDFGIRSQSGSWEGEGTAADVGTMVDNLTLLGDAERATSAATSYTNESFMASSSQDGYGEGALSSYSIGTDGVVYGNFSNGENMKMWQIPLARFTSEAGLRRTGDNLFVPTAEAGSMALGNPGSENYGTTISQSIEQSNVDLSREMVTMIVTQRGFQSNSKVVTTSDELLKTAINLKR
ncbi:MAG: flagellar hook protein FlgE [Desulfovibrio sp.]|nr:flagellar hook protein FlgE [Desulfovibrio sp.]